jgi:hypothetical protein
MALAPVLAVPTAVASMHQEVHERARQQQQVRQGAEQVLIVLPPQEVASHGNQHADDDPG